jgi:hypothetical protein
VAVVGEVWEVFRCSGARVLVPLVDGGLGVGTSDAVGKA